MRVRPEAAAAAVLCTALSLIIAPAPPNWSAAALAAEPPAKDRPAPGRLAFSGKQSYYSYLATLDAAGVETPVLPGVSPPARSDEGDARAGLIAWSGEDDGIWVWDGETARNLVPPSEEFYNGAPAISPDGEWIAFGSGRGGDSRDLWRVPVAGGEPQRITAGVGDDDQPTWSPDGTRLAFSRRLDTGESHLFVVEAATGDTVQLTGGTAGDYDPAWSPDGDSIAFSTYGRWNDESGYGTTEIAVVPASGGEPSRLIYPSWPYFNRDPAWTGNGIAFYGSGDEGRGVFRAVFAGGVVVEPYAVGDRQDEPFWNAATGSIGYGVTREHRTSRIHTVRTDGTGLETVTEDWDDFADSPAYSPDGTSLAYSRNDGDGADIVIRDLATGEEHPVPGPRPGEGESYEDPAWSPDGRHLAYGREYTFVGPGEDPVRVSALAVVDLVTGARTELPLTTTGTTHSFDAEPSWDPTGTRLVFSRGYAHRSVIITGVRVVPSAAHMPGTDTDLYLTPYPFPGEGEPVQLTDDPSDVCPYECEDRGPAWSPVDPSAIVFTRDGVPYTIDPAAKTTAELPVTGAGYNMSDPAWSWDGGTIALTFGGGEGARAALMQVPAAGGELRPLVDGPAFAGQPAYRPTADLGVTAVLDGGGPVPFGGTGIIRFTVTNLGPLTTRPRLDLTWPPGLAPVSYTSENGSCFDGACLGGPLAPSATWVVDVTVNGTAPGVQPVAASTSGDLPDPDLADNDVELGVLVGAVAGLVVAGAVTPPVAYVGGEEPVLVFTVVNGGRQTVPEVTLDLALPGEAVAVDTEPGACDAESPCALGDLAPGESAEVAYTIGTDEAVDGDAVASVRSGGAPAVLAEAVVALRILLPSILANPGLAPPGKVIQVTGTDFPPGATVGLSWSTGISGGESAVVAADGTFTAAMLIYPRDRPSSRVITAAPVTGTDFGEVTTPFLVVPGDQGPPDFIGRR